MNGEQVGIDSQAVRTLYNLIIEWRPCAQLFWCLWALLQSGKLLPQQLIEDKHSTHEEKVPYSESCTLTSDNDEDEEDGSYDDIQDDSFNYLGFCKEKMSVFWGDLIAMGIIGKDCPDVGKIDYLDTMFLF